MEVNLYNTNKKYNVIYADPPWSYQQWCNKKQGAAKAHYETMKQKDIEELPVERIADKNCILFMWATFPKLQEALATIKAWGFECAILWVGIPLLICGLIVYTELEEHCPELMGDMTDRNTEEFDKEENK